MSYCRNDDVYMYPDVGGYINCCWCKLAKEHFHPLRSLAWAVYYFVSLLVSIVDTFTFGKIKWPRFLSWAIYIGSSTSIEETNFYSYEDALEHLKAHRAAGHRVPANAFTRLRREMKSKDNLFSNKKVSRARQK